LSALNGDDIGYLAELQNQADTIFNSAEYAALSTTDDGFIDDLYEAMLGRFADAQGHAFWLSELISQGGTESRVDVITSFTVSPEFKFRAFTIFGWQPGGATSDRRGVQFVFGDDAATSSPTVNTTTNPANLIFAGTIASARISVDSGTATVEVQTKPFGSGSWGAIGSIAISSGTEFEDTTLSGWATSLTEGDQMRFKLTAITGAKRISGGVFE